MRTVALLSVFVLIAIASSGFIDCGSGRSCAAEVAAAAGFMPTPDLSTSPDPAIYGVSIVQSGLIPTWPTASLKSCKVVAGGSGYGSSPSAELLGGRTNGGSGGGSVALSTSGGAVTGCSITSGGNYSYTPQVYVSGGNGGAQVAVTLGDTTALTTSGGVVQINGESVSVPSYTHTYTVGGAGTGGYYCDYVKNTSGAWLTAPATGVHGCAPQSSYELVRTVHVQAGSAGGFPNGIDGIHYYMGRPAVYQYFDTNSKDWPTQMSEGPGGSAAPNYPCMMGNFESRKGNCKFNGNYWVFSSSDIEPVPFGRKLDGGPIIDFQRINYSRNQVAGDYLLQMQSKALNGNKSLTVAYSSLLSRVVSAGTAGKGYKDVLGAWDFYTADPGYTQGVPRFTISAGLTAASGDGYLCGQFPGPKGAIHLQDVGPSTINLCGGVTNNTGNPTGFWLNNKPILILRGDVSDPVTALYGTHGILLDAPNTKGCAAGMTTDANGIIYCAVSSARFKDDIQPLSADAGHVIDQLKPSSFTLKRDPASGEHYGLIAEEVAGVAKACVSNDADGQVYTVDYNCVTALLVAKMQEMQNEIDQLKASR